jgi:peptidoglycan/LPS O-acetylase OafA/YrhL
MGLTGDTSNAATGEAGRSETWSLHQLPSLDGLRGVAVLLVIFGHVTNPISNGILAYVGVGLFFSLSGFLITAGLLDEWADRRRIDLAAFARRRVRRLVPALAVFLVVVVATGAASFAAVEPVALYVGNWALIAGAPMAGLAHAWSLAVEEQFYLLWPLVLLLTLSAAGLRGAALAGMAGAAISIVLVIVLVAADAPLPRSVFGSDVWAAALLLGALVATSAKRSGRVVSSGIAATVGVALLMAVVLLSTASPFMVPVIGAAAMPIVGWAASHPMALAWQWLRWTGRLSYAMYLWHYPVAYGFWPLTQGLPWPSSLVVVLMLSYAAAAASWYLVERRFLRPKDTRGVAPLPAPLVSAEAGPAD